jgi:hypothetical protein
MITLEKIIEVKTFVTYKGYDDEVNVKGFNNSNLQSRHIENLKEFNRLILKKYDVQEVTTVMRYQGNGMRRLMVSFYNSTGQNSQ